MGRVLEITFFESPALSDALKPLTVKPEVELELGRGDQLLNSEELAGFELFGGLKKKYPLKSSLVLLCYADFLLAM